MPKDILLPHVITGRGRVRRVMSRIIRRFYGYTGYFQIYNMPFKYLTLFDYSEKKDLYQPNGVNAETPTAFDHLRAHQIPYYLSDWRRPEVENLSTLHAALEAGEISFAYLYMAAMDADLHAHGTHAPIIAQKIQWYNEQLRQVLHTAQSLHHDHVPARNIGLANAWIDRQRLSENGDWGATAKVDNLPETDFIFFSLQEMADAVTGPT